MDTSNLHLLPQPHVFRETLSLHTEGAAWAGQAKPNARATSLGEAKPSLAQLGQTQGQEGGESRLAPSPRKDVFVNQHLSVPNPQPGGHQQSLLRSSPGETGI